MKRAGDWRKCMDEASAFFDVARGCSSEVMSSLPPNKFIYPFVVNYVFACELYLKALLMLRDGNREFESGHGLNKLFKLQAQVDQKGIRAEYKPEMRNWTLDDALEELDKAFEGWRYAFEDRADPLCITVTELPRFARALKAYVENAVA